MATLVGKPAPKFKTQAIVKGQIKEVSLDEYKGKWVVLFFYPLDFTFVCPTEITGFADRVGDFQSRGAEVIGVSIDSQYSHLAWYNTPRNKGGIAGTDYPVLADVTKQISRDYGVLMEDKGIALRGLFIINPDGVVVNETVNFLGVGRNVDETLRLIDAFQHNAKTGEVCPANWTKGKDTINTKEAGKYFEKVK
ncbi:MAG: peroxiredoxin [Planctomycetaceae bacterium]|nr:peroxiredoxin [Planctomycetaceae bacterium]